MQQIYSGQLGGDGSGSDQLDAAAGQIGSGDQAVARIDLPVPIGAIEGLVCAAVGAIAPRFGMNVTDCHVENDSTLVLGWTQS